MKTTSQPSFGDILKLGETALSVLLGTAKEMEGLASSKKDALIRHLDLITREEFDVAFALLKKIRTAQIDLDKRLKSLEKKTKVSSPKKAAVKKQIRRKK